MEKLVANIGPPLLSETLQLCDGEVSNQHGRPGRWASSNLLVNIPDCEVDWPCLFVAAEDRELGLVRCKDDGCYCSPIR